ncbi:Gamma-conotoxin-like TeA53 [Labeo rohita]|uniref:Gamma-conotoxin-like TeA53 n=1 Tax=Labeo rohita TaxID=84645 RepID=A0ABQ8L5V2_LABRO|nr:Gamma-conotoxin-like TeA53 [Labeo rohita]
MLSDLQIRLNFSSFYFTQTQDHHRMRLMVLLLLFVTLILSDGLSNNSNHHTEINLLSKQSTPCQRSLNNGAFNTFISRHILLLDFDTTQPNYWPYYLFIMGLCGRAKQQSFLNRSDTYSIMRICNGGGIRGKDNLCISKEKFLVYVVQSSLRNKECAVQVQFERSYVTVACEAIGKFCLPVHYEGQADTAPSPSGQICEL